MANGSIGIGTTTAVSTGSGVGIIAVKWAIACIVAGHMIVPDDATETMLATAVLPILHGLDLMISGLFRMLLKKTGVDLPPPAPEQAQQ